MLESAHKQLSSLCTQLLALPAGTGNEDEAAEMRDHIDTWCIESEIRFDVISNFRQTPFHYLDEPMCEETRRLLQSFDVPFLSTLLLHVASEALKLGIDQDMKIAESSAKFFKLCACDTEVQTLNCSILMHACRNPCMASTVCSNFQSQLFGMWYDRLQKQRSSEKFALMVHQFLACKVR